MNKKADNIRWIIGFIGALAGCTCVNLFNSYVLMSLPLAVRVLCMPVMHWLIALVPAALMLYDKEKLTDIGFSRENMKAQIAVGIAMGLILSAVFTLLPHLLGWGELVDNGSRYVHVWQFIYQFIYCLIGVAAVEEFVFRGYMYAKIKAAFKKESCAILLSSVLFGLLHIFSGNLIQVFMTALLGILFCILRQKLKHCTLLSLVLAHGIYDALISVWASFFPG